MGLLSFPSSFRAGMKGRSSLWLRPSGYPPPSQASVPLLGGAFGRRGPIYGLRSQARENGWLSRPLQLLPCSRFSQRSIPGPVPGPGSLESISISRQALKVSMAPSPQLGVLLYLRHLQMRKPRLAKGLARSRAGKANSQKHHP